MILQSAHIQRVRNGPEANEVTVLYALGAPSPRADDELNWNDWHYVVVRLVWAASGSLGAIAIFRRAPLR